MSWNFIMIRGEKVMDISSGDFQVNSISEEKKKRWKIIDYLFLFAWYWIFANLFSSKDKINHQKLEIVNKMIPKKLFFYFNFFEFILKKNLLDYQLCRVFLSTGENREREKKKVSPKKSISDALEIFELSNNERFIWIYIPFVQMNEQ